MKNTFNGDSSFSWFSDSELYLNDLFTAQLKDPHLDIRDEQFTRRESVLKKKKILDDAYFVVGHWDKEKEDIPGTGLHVTSHRPYSTYPERKFTVKRRGYSRIVVTPDEELLVKNFSSLQIAAIRKIVAMEVPEEIRFDKAQVYCMYDAFEYYFNLEMENGEWLDPEKVKELVERVRRRERLQDYGEAKVYHYNPRSNNGYFLGNRDYIVWFMLVKGKGHDNKSALCIDILSGSVCLVPFEKGDQVDFTPIP